MVRRLDSIDSFGTVERRVFQKTMSLFSLVFMAASACAFGFTETSGTMAPDPSLVNLAILLMGFSFAALSLLSLLVAVRGLNVYVDEESLVIAQWPPGMAWLSTTKMSKEWVTDVAVEGIAGGGGRYWEVYVVMGETPTRVHVSYYMLFQDAQGVAEILRREIQSRWPRVRTTDPSR